MLRPAGACSSASTAFCLPWALHSIVLVQSTESLVVVRFGSKSLFAVLIT